MNIKINIVLITPPYFLYLTGGISELSNKASKSPLNVFVIGLFPLVRFLNMPLSTLSHNGYLAFPSTVKSPK